MRLTDTHAHIYEPEFDADRERVVASAVEAGIVSMLLPAIDSESYDRMFETCAAWPDLCMPMMGLHPTSVNDNPHWRDDLEQVRRLIADPPAGRICGVGEIGLDFYWSSDFRDEQIEAFEAQVDMSLEFGLPIAVHTRSAWEQMREVMRRFAGRGVRGVFHAFSDGVECYRELRGCGDFLFGIGGVVTFRRSAVAEVVREMSLDDMVLETDCPYLTPVPHRGERNEPAYVRYVCEKVAEIKGVTPEEVAARTTANAERMFLKSNERTQ